MGVETFWVSDIHPGEPTEDGKATMLECVKADDYAALNEHCAVVEMERDRARADLAASEANLAALQARWDARPVPAESVTQSEHPGEPVNPPRDPRDGHSFWDPHNEGSCYSCGCGPDVHPVTSPVWPAPHIWRCVCGHLNGPMFVRCRECSRNRAADQTPAAPTIERKP